MGRFYDIYLAMPKIILAFHLGMPNNEPIPNRITHRTTEPSMTDHTTAAAHYIAQADHANDFGDLQRLREVNADLLAALQMVKNFDVDHHIFSGRFIFSDGQRALMQSAITKAEAK